MVKANEYKRNLVLMPANLMKLSVWLLFFPVLGESNTFTTSNTRFRFTFSLNLEYYTV